LTAAPPASQVTTAPFDSAFSAVVGVYANIPETARTADSLGVRRQGSGVLIDNDGLVLTIGYLIMEADEITVVGPEGNQIKADPVAYDHPTGFGLIRAHQPIGAKALKIGTSKNLGDGTPVLAVSFGGPDAIIAAQIVSRRTFAGYWEYLLENAIFTIPPHHEFAGAALIDRKGELVGIGSLMVNDAIVTDHPVIGNMFVPIDKLEPIFAGLLSNGRRNPPVPPWLGLNTDEVRGRVYITRLSEGGPAKEAGLKKGDVIIGVGGKRVSTIIEFFRQVRLQGNAGSLVQLDVLPATATDLTIKKINVPSIDQLDWINSN
jgi:S1-C subfamily serine protease